MKGGQRVRDRALTNAAREMVIRCDEFLRGHLTQRLVGRSPWR
jgi:hypothetical protein